MIWIIDDTFNIGRSETPMYSMLKGIEAGMVRLSDRFFEEDIAEFPIDIKHFDVIACHRSLRFLSRTASSLLASEDNLRLFERLSTEIVKANVIYISFSGQINETQIHHDHFVSMNKRDFYVKLKDFIDYHSLTGQYEPKVLKFGKHFLGNELLGIHNQFLQLRKNHPECASLQDLIRMEPAARIELERYQTAGKLKSDANSWIEFLQSSYDNLDMLKAFLDKITKSFLKYGRCIYPL